MTITIERNQKIQSLYINIYIYIYIYVCMYVCIYVCMYTHTQKTKKYKRKMCYHQKNNLDVKTFKRLKNIKES